ncbi:transporter substrate-binding domain-containing protein [Sulfitobacter donghicola]|uniref:histidine kinase n=1 Tax=Sulfitobacter donghicola DSW-25 = KCTC 12864 = JCM 14565 TaxID=1300350 RepID=A0A073IE80_9RHOB|nr:transporter substrate-binding domain-containing protein [Sulfitobacter donghicola]KEJ88004.1 histidine kinase [Sulfitobacter donghicola DSW-25 = KCTC 12864 = JCM 14565]KIN69516.1 Multi-sensor hybrid histidine kinase [Sulfitobacter donghicola DSW-25 = KCTC 12864 = JCM 14565]
MTLLFFGLFLAAASPTAAQSERPTLTVGWILSPPLWYRGEDGEKTGYFIDLARLIADELDHDLVIKDYRTAQEIIFAQNKGETDLVAGGTALTLFEAENLFSLPVGQAQSRIYTHASRANDFDRNTVSGKVIASVTRGWAPEVEQLWERNHEVTPPNTADALMGLMSGDFEAIVYPEETVVYWSHRSHLDHLIVPVGAPFNVRDRVVVLNKSKADLLAPINAIINRLENDGTLAALRKKHWIDVYEPEPETLTVAFPDIAASDRGAAGFAPTYMLDKNGNPSGYAIEFFKDIANRAGLKFEIKEVSSTLMLQGPTAAGVDIIPTLGISEKRRQIMDQTLPAGSLSISATIRRADIGKFATSSDLSGHPVGALRGGFAYMKALRDPAFSVLPYDSPDQLLSALMAGKIDAALMLKSHLPTLAKDRGVLANIHEIETPFIISSRAISLRFGLGQVRERINAELPLYLLSEEFTELREEYYGTPKFWTERRQQALSVGIIILMVLVLSLLLAFFASERARRREKSALILAEESGKKANDLSGRLQAVMDASRNGVVALSRDGNVAMTNPRARDLLGIEEPNTSPLEMSNHYFSETEETTPLEGRKAPFSRAMFNGNMDGELFQLHQPNVKKAKYVRLSSSSLPLDASSEIGTVVILDDVSEYERQRKETERSGRMSAVGQLTGGVAHDFNNLLAIIMGNLELIKEAGLTEIQEGMADAGLAATRRGADLTKSLLAFSRQSRLEVEVLDPNSVVLEAQNWMRRALPESINVETSLLAGVWPVQLDRSSLESALLNLIVNARDAMNGNGNLTIETANVRIDRAYVDSRNEELGPGRYVMLAVSDTGTGIHPKDLDHLFEPFFTTKGPGEGSGVGLSMVLGFVKQSGGTVQVYSELGVGTTFKLYFPSCDTQSQPIGKKPAEAAHGVSGDVRILLAEDDDAIRTVLETVLKGAGYFVVSAPSGDAALELFHSEPPFDILVTDIVMPGKIQGTGLAKAIRPLQPGIPIIFMSGYATEATVHGNGLMPEDIRLMKPVPKQELLSAISKLLETKANKPQ